MKLSMFWSVREFRSPLNEQDPGCSISFLHTRAGFSLQENERLCHKIRAYSRATEKDWAETMSKYEKTMGKSSNLLGHNMNSVEWELLRIPWISWERLLGKGIFLLLSLTCCFCNLNCDKQMVSQKKSHPRVMSLKIIILGHECTADNVKANNLSDFFVYHRSFSLATYSIFAFVMYLCGLQSITTERVACELAALISS